MRWHELLERAAQADADMTVKVRTDDGAEHDITGVAVEMIDLDVDKKIGDTPEGVARGTTLWLDLS